MGAGVRFQCVYDNSASIKIDSQRLADTLPTLGDSTDGRTMTNEWRRQGTGEMRCKAEGGWSPTEERSRELGESEKTAELMNFIAAELTCIR